MTRIDKPWQTDSAGQKSPHHFVGKRFVHLKTSAIYVVTGYRLNASNDQWALEYERLDPAKRGTFAFARDMAEFLDGRFVEVS